MGDSSVEDYFRRLLHEDSARKTAQRVPSKRVRGVQSQSHRPDRDNSECDLSLDESSIHSSDYCSSSVDDSMDEQAVLRTHQRKGRNLHVSHSDSEFDSHRKAAYDTPDAYSVGSTTLGEDLENRIHQRSAVLASQLWDEKQRVSKKERKSRHMEGLMSLEEESEFVMKHVRKAESCETNQHRVSGSELIEPYRRDVAMCEEEADRRAERFRGSSRSSRGGMAHESSESSESYSGGSTTLGEDLENRIERRIIPLDTKKKDFDASESNESYSDCTTTSDEDVDTRVAHRQNTASSSLKNEKRTLERKEDRQSDGSLIVKEDMDSRRIERRLASRPSPWSTDMQLVVSAKPREYYNIGLETLQNQLERREGRRLTALGTRRAIEGLDPIELCSVGSTTLGEDLDRRIEQRHMLTAPSQSVENESHDSTASSSEMWEDVSDSLDSETFDDSLMESNYTASRGRSRSSRPRINASRVDPLRQPDIISLSNPMPQDGNREGLRIIDRVDRSRLQGVDYDISKLGLASNNKGISTVGPIEDTDARAAFAREVPQEVSADTDRDDVSSIGGVSYLKGRVRDLERQNRMKDDGKFQVRQLGSKVGFEARKRDLEVLKAQRVQGKSDLEIAIPSISRASNENVLSEEEWSAKRSVLELFFIGVISLSLLTLIILLGFMLAKR